MSSSCQCWAWRGRVTNEVYPARGLTFIAEFYADLDYNGDGGLIITREHDTKDPAEAAAICVRAIREGKVKSTAGHDVAVSRLSNFSSRWNPILG